MAVSTLQVYTTPTLMPSSKVTPSDPTSNVQSNETSTTEGLSKGAVAGIVVGAIVVIAVIGGLATASALMTPGCDYACI